MLAEDAARADASATIIANAVDLPHHPAIRRRPASDLQPDSDLGERLVTVAVGPLSDDEIADALSHGARTATHLMACGLIAGAALHLAGRTMTIGNPCQPWRERRDRQERACPCLT